MQFFIFLLSLFFGFLLIYVLSPQPKKIMIDVNERTYNNKIFKDDNGVCYEYKLEKFLK